MSIDILVRTTCGLLLASSGWKQGMLLNILQHPGQKALGPNVISAVAGNPAARAILFSPFHNQGN